MSSASTALYVFVYATYYFFFKTKMWGWVKLFRGWD